jgi:hypothetical protein
MAAQYIPAGRTSLVKKGKTAFQLQTEYASIPRPRVTTTIFTEGRVLHKIEKPIDKDIATVEEMHRVEDIIMAQHLEVSKIIHERGLPTVPESVAGTFLERTRSESISQLPEVERVFRITSDGKIADDSQITRKFKKLFKHILKELPEMIMVFASMPGEPGRREEGIYELEAGRILLASTGVEFFLILVKPDSHYDAIAGPLKKILDI